MPTYAAPTAAYRQQSILTATPGQLVVMLYDGCLRFLNQSAIALREGNVAEAGTRMARGEAIIEELLSTLDLEQGGVIASRLQGIYVFCNKQLIEARMQRDPEMIGQSNWYEVTPASGVGAFIVTVRLGWGDCQAGCIDEHTWVYAVLPDGTVNLQSDGGGDVPDLAWPSPGPAGDARGVT